MNKVILMGNLGADPDLRFAPSGLAILTFRLATNETHFDKNRELVERTEWHSVAMFGPRAEGLARVLVKGSCIGLEGALRTSTYEKEGQKRYRTEVHARDIHLTSGPSASREYAPPIRRDVDDDIEPGEIRMPSADEVPIVEEPRPAPQRPPRKRAARKPEMVMEEMPF